MGKLRQAYLLWKVRREVNMLTKLIKSKTNQSIAVGTTAGIPLATTVVDLLYNVWEVPGGDPVRNAITVILGAIVIPLISRLFTGLREPDKLAG